MSYICNQSLPFFAGFYESILYNYDTEYYAMKEQEDYVVNELGEEWNEDDYEFDYKTRETDIINNFIDVFKNYCPDCVEDITLETMVSPAYYNFETDRIFCDVKFSDNWRDTLLPLLKDDKVRQTIHEEWSDRDGFWSFLPSSPDEWEKDLNSDDPDARLVLQMLKYYILKENNWSKDLYYEINYEALDDIYDSEYIIKKDEKNEE